MRALVVYESMYGNTQEVAEAIRTGLGRHVETAIREASGPPVDPGNPIDLLVVGAPTHAFGLPSPRTRQAASDRTKREVISAQTGVREWLASARIDPAVTTGAAFATRVPQRWIPGSAARGIRRRLRRLGIQGPLPAVSFYVEGMGRPLSTGETTRATEWGASLGAALAKAGADRQPS